MITIILTSVAGIIALTVIGGLAYRKVRQHRTARDLVIHTPNGIVEERFVKIGGIDQWIGIRGEDSNNPVLLVLHGGPGFPYSVLAPLLRPWEKYFTIVQWDQRGAGKTMGRNGKAGSGEMTFDRMTEDGIEVAEFLCEHLNQKKVILLVSSAGTLLGVPMVQRRPDLFYAYVGTDQNVNMLHAEADTYQTTMERLHAAGNKKGIAALKEIGSDPSRWDIHAWTRKQQWVMKIDPLMRNVSKTLFLAFPLTSPTHTLRDLMDMFAGIQFSQTQLFAQLMVHDAWQWSTCFEVPSFLFQGDSDRLTPTALAEEYFADIEAPVKESALIKNAGHFAAFVQPGQFLTELLTRVRPLVVAPSK